MVWIPAEDMDFTALKADHPMVQARREMAVEVIEFEPEMADGVYLPIRRPICPAGVTDHKGLHCTH
jgi:hypothetical protein